MSFFEFPHTRTYDSDLGWLIKEMEKLINNYNELVEFMNQHKIEYQEALKELERIAKEIDTFEAKINSEFDKLKEEQQRQLENAIRAMQSEVAVAIRSLNADFESFKLQVDNTITEFKTQINRDIIELRGLIRANNDYIINWVEYRLQQFIDSFPEILTVMVYNPYRGEITDIQTVINDIYSFNNIGALTALEYDSLGLTAAEYDLLGLTAIEYDTNAYRLLYPDDRYYMISPFDGQLTLIKNVVEKLAAFHMDGLTAQSYDDKQLTASYYDSLNINAFDYDWFGQSLVI